MFLHITFLLVYLHILQSGILFGSFVGVKGSTLFLIDYIGSKQASNVQNVSSTKKNYHSTEGKIKIVDSLPISVIMITSLNSLFFQKWFGDIFFVNLLIYLAVLTRSICGGRHADCKRACRCSYNFLCACSTNSKAQIICWKQLCFYCVHSLLFVFPLPNNFFLLG